MGGGGDEVAINTGGGVGKTPPPFNNFLPKTEMKPKTKDKILAFLGVLVVVIGVRFAGFLFGCALILAYIVFNKTKDKYGRAVVAALGFLIGLAAYGLAAFGLIFLLY